VGEKEPIVGAAVEVTVKVGLLSVPEGVVTPMGPVVAPPGTVVLI